MKNNWRNAVLPIAAIFSFRMLGLFMLIPVFTVYANQLRDATPQLIGLALGSYGLTQGLLQIPFGMLSDRFGRKPIITIGLALFAIGSLWGAVTESIYGMIVARTLQGTGAIGSVLVALLADLTPDQDRTKAMAVIGATIGLSFSLAMILSPSIAQQFGLSGIFYLTVILASLGLILLHLIIPTPKKEPFHLDMEANPARIKSVIRNIHLQRLNAGIFCQHFVLTATFYSIPMLLQQQIKQGNLEHTWHFYLPLMLLSFLAMVPFIILAEKKQKMKSLFLASVFLTTVCQALLGLISQNWFGFCAILFLYFIAFNFLEASLPSLVSKQSGAKNKGTAMGVYSSCQFIGIFLGGSTAGFVFSAFQHQGIFILNALIGFVWLMLTYSMKPNAYLITLLVNYPNHMSDQGTLYKQLMQIPGIKDVTFSAPEKIIYLRIHKEQYKPGSAEQILS